MPRLRRCIPGLFGRIVAAVVASWISTVIAAIALRRRTGRLGHGALENRLPRHGRRPHAHRHRRRPSSPPSSSPPSPPHVRNSSSALHRRSGPRLSTHPRLRLPRRHGPRPFRIPLRMPLARRTRQSRRDPWLQTEEAEHRAVPAPIADYKIPGITSAAVATALAGAAGTLVVLGGACSSPVPSSPKPSDLNSRPRLPPHDYTRHPTLTLNLRS